MSEATMTPLEVQGVLDILDRRRFTMIQYLDLKVKESDWHGVADAAMDLRDIESEVKAFQSVLRGGYE